MLRQLCLAALLLTAPAVQAQTAAPPVAAPQAPGALVQDLWLALGMAGLMPVLRDEAMVEARAMQDRMFAGRRESGWLATVANIHDPARMEGLFRTAVGQALTTNDTSFPVDALQQGLGFYRGDLGRRLVALETSARGAMLDPGAEAAARQVYLDAAGREDPRVGQIARLIDRADLVGPNVAGGMNAAVAFSQGFSEAGGFDMAMSEGQMLADAWSQEAEIRAETLGWLEAYLMLSYSPLSDDELDRYIAFAGSPAGQALSRLVFAGFDAVFLQTSRDLGRAAAGQLQGRDL